MKRIFTITLLLLISGLLSAQLRIYTPELVSPIGNADNQEPGVTLDWKPVTGDSLEIKYEVLAGTDPSFADSVIHIFTTYSAYTCTELIFGTTYYWKVRATDGYDTSFWSDVGVFTTTSHVYLSYPANYSSDLNPVLSVKWYEMNGPISFELQIDTVYNWEHVITDFDERFENLFVINDTNAWAVGKSGFIVHYQDGEWTIDESHGATVDLNNCFFIDENYGMVVGKDGTLLEYQDGTWNTIEVWENDTTVSTTNLKTIHLFDINDGFIAGGGGSVFEYNGTKWIMTSKLGTPINSLFFLDENTGWAVADDGVIYKHDTETWDTTSTEANDLFDVFMTSGNNGWAVGKSGTVLHFDGTQWYESYIPNKTKFTKDIYSICMISENTGYMAAKDGYILEYANGSWVPSNSVVNETFTSVDFADENTGWAVGDEGNIIKYTGEFFSSQYAHTITIEEVTNEYEFTDMYFGRDYYWRIRANLLTDTSEWSGIGVFGIIRSVKLSKPNDGSTDQNLYLVVEWDAIQGVNNYKIRVDDDPDFKSPLKFGSDSTSIPVSTYKFDTKYYWTVFTYHSKDTTYWTDPYTFTTKSGVGLRNPANDSTDVPTKPTFKWDSLGGAGGYQLQYNTEPDFSGSCCDVLLDSTQVDYSIGIPLKNNQTYYWRVRAISPLGIDTSAWSEEWHFTTVGGIGIGEETLGNNISIYPNPSSGILNLEINLIQPSKVNLLIMDLLGQAYINNELTLEKGLVKRQIYLNNLSNGVYIIKVEKEGEIYTEKLIIDK